MIIGISGLKQSGKDTVGAMINYLTNNKFELKMFAQKPKEIVSLLTGCNIRDLENDEFKNKLIEGIWGDLTYRQLLQKVGTDFGRDMIQPNIWVDDIMKDYKMQYISGGIGMFHDPRPHYKPIGFPNWIITDVRFINEIEAIKRNKGIIIKVTRTDNSKFEDLHKSENELVDYDKFDYIISNDGTLDELTEKIKKILKTEKIIKV